MSCIMGKPKTAGLFGLGLDYDGSRRITQGVNFRVFGGSEKTHEKMVHTARKTLDGQESRETQTGTPHWSAGSAIWHRSRMVSNLA